MSSSAHDQSWRQPLSTAGLIAKGILYFALGILAVSLALGGRSSDQVSKASAIKELADLPLGKWMVLVVAVGLVALTIWNAVMAFTGDPVRGDDASDKAKFAIWTVLYGLTTLLAFRVLADVWDGGGSSQSGGGGSESAASTLMGLPGGRLVVGVVGVALVGFAVYQTKTHTVDERFMERLDTGSMDGNVKETVEKAGRVGYLARGIIAGMVGVFFVVAAFTQNPDEAGGLSQALGTLAGSTWGRIVLWVVAIGLATYGVFTLVEAKYRRSA